jgi:ketol-acid reductoisomerase
LVTVLQMADYAAYRVMPRWGVAVVGCGLRGRAHAA